MADLLRERDLIVLSDEIYSRIYYGEPPVSIASFPGMLEKTIILDGFSKTYAMTGWRMGYGVMPTWLVDAVNKLMVNSNSCTASFTQRAGIAALTGPQDAVERMVAEFRRRRDAFCAGLNTIPGFPLRAARRRVLRFRQHHRHRDGLEGTGRLPAERSGRRLPERRRLRRIRRRLYPLQLRQFAGEPDGGGGADPEGIGALGAGGDGHLACHSYGGRNPGGGNTCCKQKEDNFRRRARRTRDQARRVPSRSAVQPIRRAEAHRAARMLNSRVRRPTP